jgi:hypothetical protein
MHDNANFTNISSFAQADSEAHVSNYQHYSTIGGHAEYGIGET